MKCKILEEYKAVIKKLESMRILNANDRKRLEGTRELVSVIEGFFTNLTVFEAKLIHTLREYPPGTVHSMLRAARKGRELNSILRHGVSPP